MNQNPLGPKHPTHGFHSPHPDPMADKIARLEAANAELVAALKGIANNRLSTDVPNDEREDHNYAQGWDALIKLSSAALANAGKE